MGQKKSVSKDKDARWVGGEAKFFFWTVVKWEGVDPS